MADGHTNEYLNSQRAQDDPTDLFAAIGNQVLGLQRGDDTVDIPEDERVKIVEEIESLCMNCEENGVTRLLLTKIPYFREIILMSFYCNHCHFKNTEVQAAGEIQEHGSKFIFKSTQQGDLERQVVKSDTAVFRIEDLDIEIPAGRGRLTNVEGLMGEVLKDLEDSQKQRKEVEPELYEKIDAVLQLLHKLITTAQFTITLDDPAGNSWIEPNLSTPEEPTKYTHQSYPRTHEQNVALGLGEAQENGTNGAAIVPSEPEGGGLDGVDILEGQCYEIPVECPGCTKPAKCLIQMVNIPHFKEVVLYTIECGECGYRSSECKTGGEVATKGKRTWLHVKGPEDLGREILKSETCQLQIKECGIEVVPGTMGGRFTTVEGLLTQIHDDLHAHTFGTGVEGEIDSMPEKMETSWKDFFALLDKAIKGEMEFTVFMEDPLANSYCQIIGEPGEDKQVKEEEYERTAEEEDELGHADMKTHLNEEGEYMTEPVGLEKAPAHGQSSALVDPFGNPVKKAQVSGNVSTDEVLRKGDAKESEGDSAQNVQAEIRTTQPQDGTPGKQFDDLVDSTKG